MRLECLYGPSIEALAERPGLYLLARDGAVR